ncbi:MAG: amidohydrolase family protein [Gemmatales bacterium]|nr:amidohydrolase family protein [Gemmatales bacterium]MDW8387241.1 amidohydrolase family protein [Gemmatales bacterium]
MNRRWSVRARWIVPLDRPPIHDGILTMDGGRIAEVAAPKDVVLNPSTDPVDLGDCVVLPGLVNAHTHLDLGGLRQLPKQMPASCSFAEWLRQVVAYRRSASSDGVRKAIREGIEESLRSGVTLVGDISADGASLFELENSPLRAVVFHEVIGLTRDRARQTWRQAREWLARNHGKTRCRQGLSPHAPYSVRRGLFCLSASLCRRFGLPWATHFAETLEERQLLESRDGPLRQFLEELGAWDESGLCHGLEDVLRFTESSGHGICIHGNYLDDLVPRRLVWCPRTHAFFGHPSHPFLDLMQQGCMVALGTDSLASNPDLGILAEARSVFSRHPKLSPEEVLRMATINGAEVLGLATESGSLTPGKWADWIAVPIPSQERSAADPDPVRWLMESDAKPSDVCLGGQWVVRAGHCGTESVTNTEDSAKNADSR